MKYSQLFGKTIKNVQADINFTSHKLLLQAGFIRESTAGRYYFLPLGIRVQDKLVKIIEAEMDAAGAQKLITPTLHPLELWKETNRTNTVGFELMTVKDQRGAVFALGGTAEEMMVDLIRKFTMSYKDLPLNVYQFSQKFRDEKRARGGLLRVREFLMKDAYSFHADKADFEKEYKNMWNTYTRIFERVGLKTIVVESDNGYIGGDYCHEFVVESDVGETKFFITESGSYAAHEDIVYARKGDRTFEAGEKLIEKRGIEVGNIFHLGTHYSSKMAGAVFMDKDNKEKPYYMGCYGIGVGRTLAAVVEAQHDEKGIIWPRAIAPYHIHLLHLGKESDVLAKADELYKILTVAGFEVLYDDRDETAGTKLNDADLIGIPLRLVVSKKTLQKHAVEWKLRTKKDTELVTVDELIKRLEDYENTPLG